MEETIEVETVTTNRLICEIEDRQKELKKKVVGFNDLSKRVGEGIGKAFEYLENDPGGSMTDVVECLRDCGEGFDEDLICVDRMIADMAMARMLSERKRFDRVFVTERGSVYFVKRDICLRFRYEGDGRVQGLFGDSLQLKDQAMAKYNEFGVFDINAPSYVFFVDETELENINIQDRQMDRTQVLQQPIRFQPGNFDLGMHPVELTHSKLWNIDRPQADSNGKVAIMPTTRYHLGGKITGKL